MKLRPKTGEHLITKAKTARSLDSAAVESAGLAPRPLGVVRLAIALALATTFALALAAAPASALDTHVFSTSFGTSGSGDGQLSLVAPDFNAGTAGSGAAVNDTTHDLYVADTANARVDQFTAAGTFIRAWGWGVADGSSAFQICTTGCQAGLSGSGAGQFTTPTFVAVDNSGGLSQGDVYVADTADNLVTKFGPSGALISAWGSGGQLDGSTATDGPFGPLAGIAVDTSGNLAVYNTSSSRLFRFAQDGSFSTDFLADARGTAANGLGVDASGNFFKVTGVGSVEEFQSDGTDIGQVTSANQGTTGIAVDSSSGDLYNDTGGAAIERYTFPACTPAPFAGCPPADTFGSGHLSAAAGLAVDASNQSLFAADTGNARIDVFAPVTLPDVTTNPATSVAKTTATLNGHLDPAGGGDISDCHFAYTDDATFQAQGFTGASTIACDQATPISSAQDVTATPSGLSPSTTYHFRLLATNAQGQNQGADQTFTTVPAVDLTIAPANPIAATTATLNGHVDSNGGGDITGCHFDYIDDASFQANGFTGALTAPCTPATPISSPTDVSADISSLAAETTYHVRLVATNGDGTSQSADQPFTTAPAVVITIAPANPVGGTTATLNGHVDSNGGGDITGCHFDYTDDASFQSQGFVEAQTQACTPATPISAPTDVSADITGLSGGTTYHVRLVATNGIGTSRSADQPFTTLVTPVIDSAFASNLTPTDADLNALINPGGLQLTDCHFEWGTDSSYGSGPVPCSPDAPTIPADSADHAVTAHLAGLTQNTTYHWRILATNANGTATSPDHTFVYDTTGQGLPDNRAYEQVTPVQKNGALIGTTVFAPPPSISAGGSRLVAVSIQCLPGTGSCTGSRNGQGEPYSFDRTPTGWATTPLAPPATQFPDANTPQRTSADAGTALFRIPSPPGGQDDLYLRRPDGSFADIGPETQPSDGPGGAPVIGATADASHVFFELTGNYWPFDQTTPVVGSPVPSDYEYVGTGNSQPFLIGVSGGPGSTDLISTCRTNFGGVDNGVSADGRTVYLTAFGTDDINCPTDVFGSGANAGTPVPADALFARVDGELPSAHTVAISQRSPSDCTTPACQGSPPADANFLGASADGSKVLFTDTQQLTDAASQDSGDTAQNGNFLGGHQGGCSNTTGANGCNLYLYDSSQPAGHELVDASAGDTSGNGPRVQGAVALSSDGSHAYFVAKGVLTATANDRGQTATDGADNLYVYDAGTGDTSFIAALAASSADTEQWSGGSAFVDNVTPDGRFLVFTSHRQLTADDSSGRGAGQVFRYDAQSAQLDRISIGNNGFNDNGNSSATTCGGLGGSCSDDANIVQAPLNGTSPARLDPTMSHDGAFVFFTSPIGLTPGALDHVSLGTDSFGAPAYAQNVYSYHAGHVSLISDGHDTSRRISSVSCPNTVSSVCLIGTDASGQNVFFSTADQLVPQDTDTEGDIYDARVGGGIPFTPPPQPCSGDNCKPPPSGTPPDQTPGSSSLNGPGNQGKSLGGSATSKKKCKKHKHSKKHKHKCKKSRRANTNRGGAK